MTQTSPSTSHPWYTIDHVTQLVSNGRLTYQYASAYLHNGDGVCVARFEDAHTGENYAYGFDSQYRDGVWDARPVVLGDVHATGSFVEVQIHTGQTEKIDRLYRTAPILEITYRRNDADWTEDFIHAFGPEHQIAFVMHGMADVIGVRQGQHLWKQADLQWGHNFGDYFLAVNDSNVDRCTHHGHYIYGFINRVTGHGVGFVYPRWITTHEWKVWWTETNKIEIEYAPHGKLGRRWIFAVTEGREEVMAIGKRLAEHQTWPD